MTAANQLAGYASSLPSLRNLVINGGMKIAQRGTTGTTPNTVNYLLDRFSLIRLGGYPDNSTQTQESDSPTGHFKSLKMIRNSSHTLTGTHASALTYIVEGNDIYHLDWGSSTAKAVTISFWVKSNQIGNFPLILADSNTASDIGKLYTISNANTWEHKTIFIEGPTSGTFNTDNTVGFYIYWGFGAIDSSRTAQGSTWGVSNSSGTSKTMVSGASTALATDSGASFQITGVQLEEGTVATPFEHRPIGIEFSLCQRYYQVFTYCNFAGRGASSTTCTFGVPLANAMRSMPTLTYTDAGGNAEVIAFGVSGHSNRSNATLTADPNSGPSGTGFRVITNGVHSGITDNRPVNVEVRSRLNVEAEL